jgi:dCTP deaminase
LWLVPNEIYLACTNEECGSDLYVTCLEGRSSVGRLGMQVHLTAGLGDLGFKSHWTLEISVIKPVKVYPNVRICQAVFFKPFGTIGERLYKGKYVSQHGPVPSLMWKDFAKKEGHDEGGRS